MTVGFPAALPPPLSSLRRGEDEEEEEEEGRGVYGMDGSEGKDAIEIAIMSVNGSGWPPAPPLFNNPIITGPLLSERGIPPLLLLLLSQPGLSAARLLARKYHTKIQERMQECC